MFLGSQADQISFRTIIQVKLVFYISDRQLFPVLWPMVCSCGVDIAFSLLNCLGWALGERSFLATSRIWLPILFTFVSCRSIQYKQTGVLKIVYLQFESHFRIEACALMIFTKDVGSFWSLSSGNWYIGGLYELFTNWFISTINKTSM